MLKGKPTSTLLIIPAYNAAEHLEELLKRVARKHPGRDVLVVNDGSSDNTDEIIGVRGVGKMSFEHNRGKGAALLAGYNLARAQRYTSALSIDADLQHAPEEIDLLIGAHRQTPASVVIGSRMRSPRTMPLHRRLSNNLTSLIVSIFSGRRVRDAQSGFRLVPTHLMRGITIGARGFAFESEFAMKLGLKGASFREVPVSVIYRGTESHINPLFDTLRFVWLVWRRLWS